MKTTELNSGSWRCKHCGLGTGLSWHGIAREKDAPSCCYGDKMLPYRYTVEANTLVDLGILNQDENRPTN